MKLDKRACGIALGTILGACILLCTLWAMARGGGGHLVMLKRFFLGYSVTPTGAVIGAAYAFVEGFLGGWLFAWLYNRLAR
jgi:hypothetical protein